MRYVPVIGLAFMTLAACATPTTGWVKPGTTEVTDRQDVRQCDREADRQAQADGRPGHRQWATQGTRQVHMAGALASLRRAEHEEEFGACMRRKGYETGRGYLILSPCGRGHPLG